MVEAQLSKHMSMGIGEAEHPLLPQNAEEQHQLQEPNTKCLLRRTCLESKKIWQIAGPSIFSRLAMFSMTVITQSFAGHLGDLSLAAISIACTVLISISFGFLVKTKTPFLSVSFSYEFHPHFKLGMNG